MAIVGFVKTTLRDWEGVPCCKILLQGCNLGCPYCNNPCKDASGTVDRATIMEYIDGKLDFLEGVVISGGEPTCSPELYGLLKDIKKRKLKVKLDTNGTRPDTVDDLVGALMVDCLCINVMAPLNDSAYSKAAGCMVDTKAVRRTLKLASDYGIECIIRTVAVPGIIDEAAIDEIVPFIGFAKRYNIIQFEPENAADPAFRKVIPYDEQELRKLAERAKGKVRNVGVRTV